MKVCLRVLRTVVSVCVCAVLSVDQINHAQFHWILSFRFDIETTATIYGFDISNNWP